MLQITCFFSTDELEIQAMTKKHIELSSVSESAMNPQVSNERDYTTIDSYQAILVYPVEEVCDMKDPWHSSLAVSLHHPIFILVI